ncbi:hypothetical protein FP2506_01430 [Fulvimarina pelagi HTCC2506]|uniref:Uncharacterized protein n=1 Tax=Fulvimarina pelagi HTCC2506 TaxID=314231 RepID=Q0G211_9HYPH|nr:DUF2793 domain-containing protein [Fulvimarina pelagi]EAU41387.1 hypothetical protein FP2506_01430 [Fulvimarina pelagi HTCC2506]
MFQTHLLSLPMIAPSQAQKHVTHNEALRMLDAIVHLGVLARDRANPPGAPAEGERHIIAEGASGEWQGRAGRVAAFQDGAWAYYQPRAGWIAYVAEENAALVYDGAGWTADPFVSGIDPQLGAPKFGINADADDYNRLVVKSNSLLFTHDDASGSGNGSILGTFNKANSQNDAGFNFQNGYSTRALMGLYGDDDFRIKVTPDGGSYYDAFVVNRASGTVDLPATKAVALIAASNGSDTLFDATPTNLSGFTVEYANLGDSSFANGQLTIGPKGAGLWSFGFSGSLAASAPSFAVELLRNGSAYARAQVGGSSLDTAHLDVLAVCAAGEVFAFQGYHEAGADRMLDAKTRFFAHRIGHTG